MKSLQSVSIYIFDEIGQETLIVVFETWINRLESVIEHEGDTSISKCRMKENA
jgi:hypothetical protein